MQSEHGEQKPHESDEVASLRREITALKAEKEELRKQRDEKSASGELWALVECDKGDTAWGSCTPTCRVFNSEADAQEALMARYQAIAENPARQPKMRCHPASAGDDCAIYCHGDDGEHELHLQVQQVKVEEDPGQGVDNYREE